MNPKKGSGDRADLSALGHSADLGGELLRDHGDRGPAGKERADFPFRNRTPPDNQDLFPPGPVRHRNIFSRQFHPDLI
jgi:hypothetical protein